MTDTTERRTFGGRNGSEFLDNLARTLATQLQFGAHGTLSPDEQIAFGWGFRYGIDQVHQLLAAADREGPQAFDTISDLLDEALTAWNLGVRVRVVVDDDNPGTVQ